MDAKETYAKGSYTKEKKQREQKSQKSFVAPKPLVVPDIKYRDFIDIMAEYDIVHKEISSSLCGITVFEPCKTIYINTYYGAKEQRKTMIHEFLHAWAFERKVKLKEREVSALEDILYEKYYND